MHVDSNFLKEKSDKVFYVNIYHKLITQEARLHGASSFSKYCMHF